MYYSLTTDGMDNIYMSKETGLNSHISLSLGCSWDIKNDEIELPYRFTMSVVEGEQPNYYACFLGSHVMSNDLINALRSAGVDNLQIFPAVINHEDTGEEIAGYSVFNIVGRVSCAVMEKSDSSPLADVVYFHDLTISSARAQGMMMFRLDESPVIVLIHEKIAAVIKRGNYAGVVLEPVQEQ